MMRFSLAILTLSAVGVAGFLFRSRLMLRRRISELVDRCQKAELEKSRLEQMLSATECADMDRFGRLEHDLRSTISVITGFSALMKESVEKDALPQAATLLKGVSAIQQSASKALLILDIAGEKDDAWRREQGLRLQGKR